MDARNAGLVRRFYDEVANDGHVELIDELFAPDFVLHTGPGDAGRPGRPAVRQSVDALRTAFAGLHFDVEDVVAADDRIAARWTMTGRHVAEAFGNPATGRDISQSGMVFYRVADGRLAEQWILVDVHGLLRQLRAEAA